MEDRYYGPERRESVRLKQDISVVYRFINDGECIKLSPKSKSIIKNISVKGIHLEVETLSNDCIDGLYKGIIKLAIEIKLPGVEQPVEALTKLSWLTRSISENDSLTVNYFLGLELLDITTVHLDSIREYIIKFYLKE